MKGDINIGDLLYRSKGIIEHAGVYIGNNQVLHNQPTNGAVITSYEEFANGKTVKVMSTNLTNQTQLAMRLKEIFTNNTRYNLLENNCEHMANLIINGRKMSSQIQSSVVGAVIGGLIGSQSKNCHWFIWLAGGALTGLLVANLAKNFDYQIQPVST